MADPTPLYPLRTPATAIVWGIISLCAIVAIFVLVLTFLRPAQDNTNTILLLLGVVAPVITALLAAAVQQVHLAVNGRLSQLLELTARSSHAEGKLDVLSQVTYVDPTAPPKPQG